MTSHTKASTERFNKIENIYIMYYFNHGSLDSRKLTISAPLNTIADIKGPVEKRDRSSNAFERENCGGIKSQKAQKI